MVAHNAKSKAHVMGTVMRAGGFGSLIQQTLLVKAIRLPGETAKQGERISTGKKPINTKRKDVRPMLESREFGHKVSKRFFGVVC